jgi:uncharacterized DUF497 family protein
MKHIDWDESKNAKLQLERGISFEEILTAIDEGSVLDDAVHPNSVKYPSQRVLVVLCRNYVYLVPYVEDETKMFLKSIIPSRKATRKYLRGGTK